jgi:hypothetical protein
VSTEPEAVQEPASPAGLRPWVGDLVTALTYSMLLVAGLLLGLLGAFHVASRPAFLGVHWPVAVVVAAIGNLGLGLLGGWGLRGRAGAAVGFLGWIIGVGVVMFGGSDDVVIGGSPGDWVPLGFLVAGAAAGVVSVVVALRFADPATRPAPVYGSSSLRAPGRR